MPRNIVIPEHVRQTQPGKRAAKWAAHLEQEARRQEEARREAERLKEAERLLTAEREQTVAKLAEEMKATYAERLGKLGDPIFALSSTCKRFKEAKDKLAATEPRAAACVSEAWRRFEAELPLLAYS